MAFHATLRACLPRKRSLVLQLAATMRTVTLVGAMYVFPAEPSRLPALLDSELPVVGLTPTRSTALLASLITRSPDFPELTRRTAPLIMTPHRRELGRLVNQVDNPPASLVGQLEAAGCLGEWWL